MIDGFGHRADISRADNTDRLSAFLYFNLPPLLFMLMPPPRTIRRQSHLRRTYAHSSLLALQQMPTLSPIYIDSIYFITTSSHI
jgi:hypothetical protein